jgi:predicted dehydrogenase
VKQGLGLLELATKYRLTLMVGHVFMYNPAIRKVKEYLDAGHLGKVFYVSMVRTNLGPIRVDVNAAWDLAAHDLSIANYWLNAEPLSVSALGGTWLNQGIEDAVFATLEISARRGRESTRLLAQSP